MFKFEVEQHFAYIEYVTFLTRIVPRIGATSKTETYINVNFNIIICLEGEVNIPRNFVFAKYTINY